MNVAFTSSLIWQIIHHLSFVISYMNFGVATFKRGFRIFFCTNTWKILSVSMLLNLMKLRRRIFLTKVWKVISSATPNFEEKFFNEKLSEDSTWQNSRISILLKLLSKGRRRGHIIKFKRHIFWNWDARRSVWQTNSTGGWFPIGLTNFKKKGFSGVWLQGTEELHLTSI